MLFPVYHYNKIAIKYFSALESRDYIALESRDALVLLKFGAGVSYYSLSIYMYSSESGNRGQSRTAPDLPPRMDTQNRKAYRRHNLYILIAN